MTREEIRAAILEEIGTTAPKADLAHLDPADDIRDALDMDSMDVLNLVIALHKRLRVDIPEADAARFVTVDDALDYLADNLR